MKEKFSHFVPLLIFTAFMILAAGTVMAVGAAHAFHAPREHPAVYLAAALALIAAGLAASFFHLGRKDRAHRAVLGLAHSWLSREVVSAAVFGQTTALAFLTCVTGGGGMLFDLFLYGAVVSSVLLLAALGMVYRLPRQRTWKGPATLASPLLSAGFLAAGLLVPGTEVFPLVIGFSALGTVDFVLFLLRVTLLIRASKYRPGLLFPNLATVLRPAFVLRLVASIGAWTAALLFESAAAPALIALSILLDRFLFYAGAVKETPRSETAKIKDERMKAAASPRNQ